MALLALYGAVLARYAGRDDLLIGVPVSGRTQAETEHLIGLFTNTLPLRLRTHATMTFAELLDQARTVTVTGLAHQRTSRSTGSWRSCNPSGLWPTRR